MDSVRDSQLGIQNFATRVLLSLMQISVSPVNLHAGRGDGMDRGCRGDEATPTTQWRLQPAVYDGGWEERGKGRRGEGEEGSSDSSSSSQYNECWQSTSTIDTTRQGEEGEGEGEGEGVEEREEGGGGGTEEGVDGATGQSTIAKSVLTLTHETQHTILPSSIMYTCVMTVSRNFILNMSVCVCIRHSCLLLRSKIHSKGEECVTLSLLHLLPAHQVH